MDPEARGTGTWICQKMTRSKVRRCQHQDPCKPFIALARRRPLFSRSSPGLARSLPVMTKLILVVAAASGGAVGGQPLKVNGTRERSWARHRTVSGRFREVGEVMRDAAESGSAGGEFDHNEASVGHVNMLTARVQTHLVQALIRNLPYW